MKKTCPKCNTHAANKQEVKKLFGLRAVQVVGEGFKEKPQSYCRACRSKAQSKRRQQKTLQETPPRETTVNATDTVRHFRPVPQEEVNGTALMELVLTKEQVKQMNTMIEQANAPEMGVNIIRSPKGKYEILPNAASDMIVRMRRSELQRMQELIGRNKSIHVPLQVC